LNKQEEKETAEDSEFKIIIIYILSFNCPLFYSNQEQKMNE